MISYQVFVSCEIYRCFLQWHDMKQKLPVVVQAPSQSMSKSQIFLVGLLVVASFLLGSLYTKVQYLQNGGGGAPTAAGSAKAKYKSFEDAMGTLAKEIKIDSKKLVNCMNGGEKKSAIDVDVAAGNSLGVNGTPAFFINGKLLGGAFPFDSFKEVIDKELSGTGSINVVDYSQALQDAAKQGAFDPTEKVVSVVDTDNARGPKDAKVTIVEFSDFQCPFCSRVFPTVEQIMKEYNGKVRLVFKNFPLLSLHPHAQKAAEAAACAKAQGKFWEFHDKLFTTQADWSTTL